MCIIIIIIRGFNVFDSQNWRFSIEKNVSRIPLKDINGKIPRDRLEDTVSARNLKTRLLCNNNYGIYLKF